MSYYNKALPSCKEKILAWDRKDFSELAASMDQEEIRSMVRELFEEYFYPNFDNETPEMITYNYILLLAYEAETIDEDAASDIYDVIYAIESVNSKKGD